MNHWSKSFYFSMEEDSFYFLHDTMKELVSPSFCRSVGNQLLFWPTRSYSFAVCELVIVIL